MRILVSIVLFIAVSCVFNYEASAQQQYWVFFKDKSGVEFNPHTYFDKKTINRRKKQGIPLNQYTDRPVNNTYINEILKYDLELLSTSRWLNAVMVKAKEPDLQRISEEEFVESVTEVKERIHHLTYDTSAAKQKQDLLNRQVERFGDSLFKKKGIEGKGIRIAVLDAGFTNADNSSFLAHLHEKGNIKATYDFIQDEQDVYGHSIHGTMVLSCIAGIKGNKGMGLAPEAEFLLARTEYAYLEPFSEEQNWFEALEWADKKGADIVSSSLGYTYKRYFKQQMDGETSLVSKAARIAASKGMLLVISMGNEGFNRWKVLSTPADADSIISVGGLNPSTGIHTNFSSFGPTADMRLKPELTAYGHVVAAGQAGLVQTQGTSFSAPLVAGFAACAWQMHPEWTNMQLLDELCKSGDLYPYYDYAHGYGVPQAKYFITKEESLEFFNVQCHKDGNYIHLEFDNPGDKQSGYFPYLFYHVSDSNGVLKEYAVVKPESMYEYKIPYNEKYKGLKLRFHLGGRTAEIEIP